mgnify:CR=1 FL=1
MAKLISTKPSIREKSIKIRVTIDEFLQLKQKADGKPLAPFMRDFCINANIPKSRKLTPKVDPEFMRAFAGACNNINQLTKQINTYGFGVSQEVLRQEVVLLREEIEKVKNYASQF